MAYIKEDRKELARLYSLIGNHLAAELPEGWTHVCLGFFVDKRGHEEMLIFVSRDAGNHWHDFMDDVFAADAIMEGVFDCKECCQALHELCTKTGDKWTSFTLIMDAEGHFRAEYSYDECDRITPAVKAMWMGEYLE